MPKRVTKSVYKEGLTLNTAIERYVLSLGSKPYAQGVETLRNKLFGCGRSPTEYRFPIDLRVSDLTPTLLEELSTARRLGGNAPQTIRHELSMIRAAVYYVAGLGEAFPSQFNSRAVKNPWRLPKVKQKTRYLSMEEYALVQSLLKSRGQVVASAIAAVLCYTGMRWSELANLRWNQINFDAMSILVYGSKTEQARMVPMPEQVAKVLIVSGGLGDLGSPELVFPDKDGLPRPQAPMSLRKAIHEVADTPASVAQYGEATVHTLRHTYASWLVQNGAELTEVGSTLGHKSLAMTQRYAHLSKGKTVAKLGGILNSLTSGGQ